MARPDDDEPTGGGPRNVGGHRMGATAREKVLGSRGPVGRVIDQVGHTLATPYFFTAFTAFHLLWILLNLRIVPGFDPWDPYPFTLLATIASVEAPIVALLILMRQQRDRVVDEIRDEVILQVSLHIERESTEALRMLGALGERLEVEFGNEEVLAQLGKPLDPDALIASLEQIEEKPPGEGR